MSEITLDNAENSVENESDDSLQTEVDETGGLSPEELQEARKAGWAPKDKWRGKPDEWKNAKEFHEYALYSVPALKKRLDIQDKELRQVREAAKAFEKFTKETSERELAAKIAELEEKRAQAITEGDGKAAVQAEKELKKIEQAPAVLPEYKVFIQENPWYDADSTEFDPERRAKADYIAVSLQKKYPDLKTLMGKTVEQLKRMEEAEARMLEEESGTTRPSAARGGKPAGNNSKVKTFDNMSPEYKDAAKQLIAAGMITKEKYVQKLIDSKSDAWGE